MKHPPPTPRDVARAQAGDAAALNRVVLGMEGMCWLAARRFAPHTHLDMEDLVQEARMAVLRAVRTFNPTKGAKFSSYSYTWMRAFLSRLLHKERHEVYDSRGHKMRKRPHVSIDSALTDDGFTLSDALACPLPSPEQVVADREQEERVFELTFTELSPREGKVARRHLAGERITDIAEDLGLSRQRVDQLKQRSLEALRAATKRRRLA